MFDKQFVLTLSPESNRQALYSLLILFIGYYQDLVSNFDFLIKQIKPLVEQVYMGVRISDQDHTKYPYIFNEAYLRANEGYTLTPYKYDNVQVIEEEQIML